jgi:hypothetical protein
MCLPKGGFPLSTRVAMRPVTCKAGATIALKLLNNQQDDYLVIELFPLRIGERKFSIRTVEKNRRPEPEAPPNHRPRRLKQS